MNATTFWKIQLKRNGMGPWVDEPGDFTLEEIQGLEAVGHFVQQVRFVGQVN